MNVPLAVKGLNIASQQYVRKQPHVCFHAERATTCDFWLYDL